MVNAGCREKDLKHINEQLEKYNVSCCVHAPPGQAPTIERSTSGVAAKRAAPQCPPHMRHTQASATRPDPNPNLNPKPKATLALTLNLCVMRRTRSARMPRWRSSSTTIAPCWRSR